MVYNIKAEDMAFDIFRTKELYSALRVDRLAEAKLAKQDGLEEQSMDQKFGDNLRKKTKAKKGELEEAGYIVSNNKAGDIALNFFKTKVMMRKENKFEGKL